MSAEVAVRPAGALSVDHAQTFWTPEQRAALAQLGIDEASNGDLAVFLNYAQRTGLDPFSRQIYMISRNERTQDGGWRKKWTIQASIDGLRIIAQRSGDYAGQVGPEWCGPDGQWRDVWLDPEPPAAARVGVLRTGFAAPLYAVALYREYVGTDKQGKPTRMWAEKGALMIAKCAEALALRKAFPNDLSGVYTSEELSKADVPAVTADVTAAVGHHEVVDYQPLIDSATTLDEIRAIWRQIGDAGQLNDGWTAALNEKAHAIQAADNEQVHDAELVDEPPADSGEPASRGDLQRLSIRLGELGIKDRQDRLDWTGAVVGRVITSSKDLTHDEAERAIARADADLKGA